MSVANLTRYNADSYMDTGIIFPGEMIVASDGGYVKFEEAVEASSNSLQQLKAEIAALADRFERESHGGLVSSFYVVQAMRQLSAV